MSSSVLGSNGLDGTSGKGTITVAILQFYSEELLFSGGSSVEKFLKPEETELAIVSKEENFYGDLLGGLSLEGAGGLEFTWVRFLDELGRLLKKQNPVELYGCSSNFCLGSEKFRVVICSTTPLPLNAQLFKRKRSQDDDEFVTLPMKLKVIANMSSWSREEKEQSCLTKLVRLCGPQNVRWVIEGLGKGNTFPCHEPLIELLWNEEDLAFEGEAPLTFRKADMRNFGKITGKFETEVKMLGFRLTYAGVNQVLREIYGRPGQDWRLKQKILEEESFADLAIVSENSKDQGTVKCHKVQLASASRVFASMLMESATWEEAKTGTITLPESEDAIRAMVHFIYYGGTDRIFGNRMDVVVELLQAGHKYELKDLVEVASFVLLAIVDGKEVDKWFSVDAALELFRFSSLQEGNMWKQLKKRSVNVLRLKTKEERMASEGFQRLYQIALKIGPVFGIALDYLGKPLVKLEKEEQHLPASINNVTQEEAKLLLDIWYADGWIGHPLNVEILLGMTMLAEYCGRPAPELGDINHLLESLKLYDLGFLLDLLTMLKRRDDKLWKELKPGLMEIFGGVFKILF